MNNDFDKVLDVCLDRVARGESIDSCLADYPARAADLRPLLEAAAGVAALKFTPSDSARRRARLRFHEALDKRRKAPFWARFPAWVAAAAGVLLIVAVGLSSLDIITLPGGGPPTIVVSSPSPADEANFRFLVSDEPNDIGDFTSLMVTVEKVSLLKKGDGEAWVSFTPEVKEFDLTQLIGEASQQVWQGQVPEGDYAKVEVLTAAVTGTLQDGSTVDIKLPSGKLQLNFSFTVGPDTVTSFVFDITVNKTGQGSGKYILKPQAGESGATYENKP